MSDGDADPESQRPYWLIEQSPWDADKLIVWTEHNGERYVGGHYMTPDEAESVAETLRETAQDTRKRTDDDTVYG